jgi:meiotically up-regulated gene 157 (Mug157) protein
MKGAPKYRKMQAELDKNNCITTIVRNYEKSFSFIINGEVIKAFKKRDSANQRIKKLYEAL